MRFKQTYMKLMEGYTNIPAIFKAPTEEDRKIRKDEYISKMDIFELAENGYIDELKRRIDAGVDVNAKNKYDSTPLILASGNGHIDIAKYLINKGADVNAKNKYDNTSLIWASSNGCIAIVQLLKQHGAK